jgi:hypothetical protein
MQNKEIFVIILIIVLVYYYFNFNKEKFMSSSPPPPQSRSQITYIDGICNVGIETSSYEKVKCPSNCKYSIPSVNSNRNNVYTCSSTPSSPSSSPPSSSPPPGIKYIDGICNVDIETSPNERVKCPSDCIYLKHNTNSNVYTCSSKLSLPSLPQQQQINGVCGVNESTNKNIICPESCPNAKGGYNQNIGETITCS